MEATVPFTHRIGLEWCYLLGDFGVRIEGKSRCGDSTCQALSFGEYRTPGTSFFMVEILPIICRYRSEQMALLYIFLIIVAHLVAVEKDGKRLGETTFAPYDLEVGQADSIDLVLFGNRVNTFGAVHMVGEDDRFLNPGSWRT